MRILWKISLRVTEILLTHFIPLNTVKKLYNEGCLVLTQKNIKKLQNYFEVNRVLNVAGMENIKG